MVSVTYRFNSFFVDININAKLNVREPDKFARHSGFEVNDLILDSHNKLKVNPNRGKFIYKLNVYWIQNKPTRIHYTPTSCMHGRHNG